MSNASFTYAIIFAASIHLFLGVLFTLPEPEITLNKAPNFMKIKLGQREAPAQKLIGHLPKEQYPAPEPLQDIPHKITKIENLAALEPSSGEAPKETPPKKDVTKSSNPQKMTQTSSKPIAEKKQPRKQSTPRRPQKKPTKPIVPIKTLQPQTQQVKGSVLGNAALKEAQDGVTNYEQLLSLWSKKHTSHIFSRHKHLKGEVDIWIRINREGAILATGIHKQSTNVLFDRHVLKTLTNMKYAPKPPSHYPMGESKDFILPFNYSTR